MGGELSLGVVEGCVGSLSVGAQEWWVGLGAKLFRFNNFWLENGNFKGVVEESWRNLNVERWMNFVLKEKLKGLKAKIKGWNRKEYGGMEERVEKLEEEIKGLDELSDEVGGLSEREVEV